MPTIPSADRPPHVLVQDEQPRVLLTADGLHLEAICRVPPGAIRAVVLCHPHPLYGGTMHNAIMVAFARVLRNEAGSEVATIRFNYRGVEQSEGAFDDGRGEVRDAVAAIDLMVREAPGARIAVVGYSFGAWVALSAALEHDAVDRVALVAPAVKMFAWDQLTPRARMPIEVVAGAQDQLVSLADARSLAHSLSARLHVLDDADHSFVRHRRQVTSTLIPFIAPEANR